MSDQILDDDFIHGQASLDPKIIQKINSIKDDVNHQIKDIKQGRNALIFICILAIIGVPVMLFLQDDYSGTTTSVIIEAGIIFLIYLSCVFGIKLNAKIALTVAFSFFILIQILYLFIDPSTFMRGLLVKGLLIFYLGKGMLASFKFHQALKQLARMGIGEEEIEIAKDLRILRVTPIPPPQTQSGDPTKT